MAVNVLIYAYTARSFYGSTQHSTVTKTHVNRTQKYALFFPAVWPNLHLQFTKSETFATKRSKTPSGYQPHQVVEIQETNIFWATRVLIIRKQIQLLDKNNWVPLYYLQFTLEYILRISALQVTVKVK